MRPRFTFGVLLALTALAPQVHAQTSETAQLLKRFERLERENSELKRRIVSLEEAQRSARPDTPLRNGSVRPAVHTAYGPGQRADVFPSKTSVTIAEQKNSFDGMFFTVGATALKSFALNDWSSVAPLSYSRLSGDKFGGSFGYNVTSNRLLFGLELNLAVANAREVSYAVENQSTTLPWQMGYGWCSGCTNSSWVASPSMALNYQSSERREIRRMGSAELSFRAGMTFADWLLFTRVGSGLDLFRQRYSTDASWSNCIDAIATRTVDGSYFQDWVTSCTSIQDGQSHSKKESYAAMPYLVAGLGIERNFGSYFGRAEASISELLPRYNKLGVPAFGAASISVSAGKRF